jgi:hypothetical protein
MAAIEFREQANGHAYTLGAITVLFRHGDLDPQLILGEQVVTVGRPERFGARWDKPSFRRAWVRAFCAARG